MNPHIVFYQQYAVPYFGILSIVTHLKHEGLTGDIIIEALEERPIERIRQLRPRLVGISVMSPEHTWLIPVSRSIRKALPDVIIIVGGVHAIFYPEEILAEASVDLVCHSEGEEVLINVIKELEKPAPDWASVQGISYKDNQGNICTNERAALVPFDDNIIENKSIYYSRYPQLAKDDVHRFFSSRGCPFRCSFCYNAGIHDVFKGKGQYVRQKSVQSFIKEIHSECEKYEIKFIFFYDDLFTFDKEWLKEFLEKYKEQVRLPFWCTTRVNVMDEERAMMLADAGCRTVSYGIETGNYYIRKNILNKDISDDDIIHCGSLIHKYGMKTQTANMFCLPDETIEDALQTIELNISAKADYAFTALFLPFPKTEITNYCIQRGFLKPDYSLKDIPYSFLTSSVLNIPEQQKETIRNIHRLAYFFVKWPWLFKTCKKVVNLISLAPLFEGIFLFANVFRHKEERGISWWATIRYAWRLRKSF